MKTQIVRFENVSKSFKEGEQHRHVLKDVSIGFEAGRFTALLGPSGSGKSTLLNLACGIDFPDQGDVFVQDVPITRLSDHERTLFRRDNIGFVFQFFNLISTLTVLENVTLPMELAGQRRQAVEAHAMTLLERVGLADRRNTFPDKLSGGEQQRVAICRALAHNPQVVLADEPTGNLDRRTGDLIMQLLLDITREAGKTLIMATHSVTVAETADHLYRVRGGRLVTETPAPEESASEAAASLVADAGI